MSQVTAIISRIFMNSDYNVMFYDQYDNLVQTIETATFVEVVGTYLVCGDGEGNSCKFFANTVTLIEGPTFSQSYTPIPAGFYQQDQAYFNRLSEMYTYINTNVVNVVIRWIDALKFADGTTQTTAAGGGGGSGTVTSVGFTAGTGITVGGTNPITTSGTVTITNSAPDQTVVINNGTGISTSGTYPNFTIANTAPDQVVTLTEGAGIDVTGTYPNFTIASTIDGGIKHGVASGTDTYSVSITGPTAYNDGDAYLIRFTNGNTTVATLNINGIGAIDLYRNNDGPIIAGDIEAGSEMLCVYNSTANNFQCIGTSPNSLITYVTNDDTVTITKGQPVYASGGVGDRLKVKRAYNTSDATSAQTIGLVMSTSIASGQKGFIMIQGLLDGLSIVKPVDGWADGNAVYLGPTAGTITNVKQYAPNHLVYLGFVTTASTGSAGRIYVRVQNGYELDELHNVDAKTPNDKDGIFYNTSTSLWEHKSIADVLGYTPGQGTLTSIATTSPILGGTITTSGTISIQQADASKDGYISVTDWNTFNNKQNAITLTTTGTSGAATLVGSTLNVPQYAGSGTGSSQFFVTGSATGLAAATTRYGNVAGTTAESQVRFPLSSACTITDLYVRTTATMNASASLQVAVYKNGTITALTLTIAGGSVAGTYSNTANSATFAAGDGWTLGFINAGSVAAAASSGQSVKITI